MMAQSNLVDATGFLLDGVGSGVSFLLDGVSLFLESLFLAFGRSHGGLVFQGVGLSLAFGLDGVGLLVGGVVGGAVAGRQRSREGEGGGGGKRLANEHKRFLFSRPSGGCGGNAPVIGRFTQM